MWILGLMAAALAFFGAAGGGVRKKTGRGASTQLRAGDPCDPILDRNLPPEHGCYLVNDEYIVAASADPMARVDVNYGDFVDDQGVSEALGLLGFAYDDDFRRQVALFQEYITGTFELASGAVRLDGVVDNTTIGYVRQALDDYEAGTWVTPQEQQLEMFEVENAENVVAAWDQEPIAEWTFEDGDVMAAPENIWLSAWLTNIVYWGTYGAGQEGSEAPKMFFPVPFTDQWKAETKWREAWLRIQEHVKHFMQESGLSDVRF